MHLLITFSRLAYTRSIKLFLYLLKTLILTRLCRYLPHVNIGTVIVVDTGCCICFSFEPYKTFAIKSWQVITRAPWSRNTPDKLWAVLLAATALDLAGHSVVEHPHEHSSTNLKLFTNGFLMFMYM